MGIRSYRELEVWQRGIELVERVYSLTATFPVKEQYGLTSQIQRAVVSIPSNIAEGHSRASRKEFLHFVSIALGSLAELETQVIITSRLTYLGQQDADGILAATDQLGKMLRSLQKSLRMDSPQSLAPSPQATKP